MELIDTHCHLTHGRLRGQLEAVLDRARQAGVRRAICAAGDLAESRAAAAAARSHEGVFCLAGVHPHDAKDAPEGYLDDLESLAAGPRCVAVGEIGLDYHYDHSPRRDQRRVFAEQLALARRLGARIVVHTREAFADTLAILRESGADGSAVVFHSFTEGPEAAGQVLDLGAAISFSGIVTFRSARAVQAAARAVPDDRLLVETDAPFLSPQPVRNVRTNEPAHVAHVAAFLAALRGEDADALAERTTRNAERVFRLPSPA
jgi:TatD DNase family protein